jgi:tetratricopeptide (TPR) repeat protein
VLAIAREKAGDLGASVRCYERALQLLPNASDIANDLGRLAYRLGLLPVAEKLFGRYLEANPGAVEGVNNLACTLRDQGRFEDAIELLRPSINAEAGHALLWNTLGTILTERGDMAGSLVFFDEALRLDPAHTKARYNRANAKLSWATPKAPWWTWNRR